jgi:cytochrome P450 family 6
LTAAIFCFHIFSETLRIYPISGQLSRQCTKRYTIPDTDVQIEVGDVVTIPVYGLHHNAEFYPDPEVFDPDRFTEEVKKTRPHFTYLPFGEGPRQCIGMLSHSKILDVEFIYLVVYRL